MGLETPFLPSISGSQSQNLVETMFLNSLPLSLSPSPNLPQSPPISPNLPQSPPIFSSPPTVNCQLSTVNC
ncbi:hypothetical protein [Microcoleus sp. CAWBG24]|uniref:hypothetical protein n=1 Tax=Microcoleus sp. CAWBG24 TaxID=2841644 RepID=UPI0025FC4CB5|nr:hypothetical protein [Microcoleus sp. CAWBG24]